MLLKFKSICLIIAIGGDLYMITLSKLASLANVSVSTASKAFSMSSEVNEETREMIFKVAREQGCFKKFYNAKYPKFVIAVICPEFESRFYSRLLSIIQKHLTEYNCEVCVASTDFSAEGEKNLLEYYNKYATVDGIIIIKGTTIPDKNFEIPIVTISSGSETYEKNMEMAIKYFVDKNITSIGFIGENLTMSKLEFFKKIMTKLTGSYRQDFISITSKRFEDGGYHAMETLFSNKKLPRAIICAYDYMAIGAIKCIYDRGLKIPEDIAIIGSDDLPESSFLNPPLSTIRPCIDTACKAAVDAIMGKLRGTPVNANALITHELILRKSSEV